MGIIQKCPPALKVIVILLLVTVLSIRGLDLDLSLLISRDGLGQILSYFVELYPPDLSQGFLKEVLAASIETLAISIMGTLFAIVLAIVFTPFAIRSLTLYDGLSGAGKARQGLLRGGVIFLSRALLNLLRAIPELLWAIIFILIVGLGPFAGVLALALHTGGVLGKLYADVLENVDPGPVESIAATGAGRLKVFFYGILPQALPQCLSYTLYRWEMNIRGAAILGFVGAGGIGLLFYKAISLFHTDRVFTLIVIVFLMVNLVDNLSLFLRKRLL